MIAGTVAAFFLIQAYGRSLTAPAPQGSAAPTIAHPAATSTVFGVLLALAAVMIVGRLLRPLLNRIDQPPVICEVLAGILIGPSLLGWIAPPVTGTILAPPVVAGLDIVGQVGVIFFMFLVGLEFNSGLLRGRAHAIVAISHASIIAPFVLGSLLAILLCPRLSTSDVTFTSFALFTGVAMSVTAFPVLARILTDRGMTKTQLGSIALACAATDDVTAWCLLALLVSVARARPGTALVVIALLVVFAVFMLFVVRSAIERWTDRFEGRAQQGRAVALVMIGVLLSALTTEAIGVHAVFGAFLFGVCIPHSSALSRAMSERLHDVVTILFLPAFFASTGLRTEIGLLSGADRWVLCGLVLVVATLGKFGGTYIAARFAGLGHRQAGGLGALMNTRGLMGLIVLRVGLDLGIISGTMFTMMVLMALVTTMATTPLLRLFVPRSSVERMIEWTA
jgi:Kef-type K+ transport system membrane component KefB